MPCFGVSFICVFSRLVLFLLNICISLHHALISYVNDDSVKTSKEKICYQIKLLNINL